MHSATQIIALLNSSDPYNPDFALSDFHLFRYLKHHLCSNHHNDEKTWKMSISTKFQPNCIIITNFMSIWIVCIADISKIIVEGVWWTKRAEILALALFAPSFNQAVS